MRRMFCLFMSCQVHVYNEQIGNRSAKGGLSVSYMQDWGLLLQGEGSRHAILHCVLQQILPALQTTLIVTSRQSRPEAANSCHMWIAVVATTSQLLMYSDKCIGILAFNFDL